MMRHRPLGPAASACMLCAGSIFFVLEGIWRTLKSPTLYSSPPVVQFFHVVDSFPF